MAARRATKAPAGVLDGTSRRTRSSNAADACLSDDVVGAWREIRARTKPSATVRIGSSKAAIWANDNSGGTTCQSVTFERLYKDGDAWKSTRSFSRDDLLVLAKVADLAYSRILELQEQPESA